MLEMERVVWTVFNRKAGSSANARQVGTTPLVVEWSAVAGLAIVGRAEEACRHILNPMRLDVQLSYILFHIPSEEL